GGAITELAKNGPGVLAHRRDRLHARLKAIEVEGRLERIELAGGGADARPAPARRELRVAPELLHRVQPRAGDIGRFEPVDGFLAAHLREGALDLGVQGIAVLQPGGTR